MPPKSMLTPSFIKHAVLLAGSCILLGHSAAHADAPRDHAAKGRSASRPATISSAQFLYQALLGEIAARRGAASTAVASYLDLTRKTHDPRIARRATEIALQYREMALAAEAARLWLEVEPESQTALQTVTAITADSNQTPAELEASIKAQLEKQPGKRGVILLQIPQLLSRYPDPAANRGITNRLTEPYLKLPEAHYVRGIAAAIAQDLAGGVAEANAALALRPDWEDAAILRWRASPAERRADAAAELRAFGEANPKAADARLNYIRWLASEKRNDEAQKAADALLADSPENNDLRYAIAIIRVETGDLAGAEQLMRQLLDRGYPEADLLRLLLGQLVEEQKRFPEALNLYAEVPIGRHFAAAADRQARLLFKQGKLADARRILSSAASRQPDSTVQLQLVEADLLRQADKPAESFEVLELTLVLEPDNTDALYMSAMVAEPLKKYDLMEERLRKVMALKPDYAQAYNALGYSLTERNLRLDEAEPLLEKALSLAPEDAAILDSVAWLRFRQGKFDAAKEMILRAMAKLEDAEILSHYVEILYAAGDSQTARSVFASAKDKFPDNHLLRAVGQRLGF
ncbi:MAG: tetratricopeptide repeat protein [Uliginosibacterium sp.]|nr:tetratricopeptide repeat protein [Uliginosibacterium sp.]